MKLHKRIIGVIVTVIFLLKQAEPITAGQVIREKMEIQLKNNPGITAVVADISYDQKNLTLLEVKDAGLMEDLLFLCKVRSYPARSEPFGLLVRLIQPMKAYC